MYLRIRRKCALISNIQFWRVFQLSGIRISDADRTSVGCLLFFLNTDEFIETFDDKIETGT